ncbi:BamA/TamA family outer membrane protein [Arsukibacterium sp.]|uniref:BamA/TamA family outer membrane protein n=1 Tax=Arsukibacterium sp. TaxID=1977258 RepID=UPI00263891F2|nr:BamA/TamA family outer membrane protein [Arsukibacterium sp.]
MMFCRMSVVIIMLLAGALVKQARADTNASCTTLFDEADLQKAGLTISAIHFEQQNVFDLSEPGTFWLHRFANYSHIISKEVTIANDLLFAPQSPLDLAELAETERILRGRSYIRDADVEVSHYCPATNTVEVLVKTWDNWSLLPKIDFSSEGGSTEYSIGIAEDNLLGTGNQLQLDYAKDAERTGYLFSFASPNIMGSHWQALTRYANNSDGESYQVNIQRPFYRLSSPWAVSFDVSKDKQQITDYVLGEKVNQYDRTQQGFSSFVGLRLAGNSKRIHRLNSGVTLEDVSFTENADTLFELPAERNLSRVWVEYQLLEDQYRKLYNINQFNRVEDINLGWQAYLRLGHVQKGLGADANGWQVDAAIEKAWSLQSDLWLLGSVRYHGLKMADLRQQLLSTHWQLVYQLSRQSSVVGILDLQRGQDLFEDEALYLGGDTGLRAFPLFYQRGDNRMVATAEYRYYTDWNILHIFDVGFAGFADAGRSWGAEQRGESEIDDSVLYGVGVGVRLLSTHSSRGTMVHIDLTRPVTDNPELGNWQWRVTAKRRF